jgi:DNA polymerase IV (archaeal DinB-like DNA polymerase)
LILIAAPSTIHFVLPKTTQQRLLNHGRAKNNILVLSRIVGHLDLDYFYAQVEEIEAPSLKDKPVLVCVFSGRTEKSGVVSTSNYKAREYGIKSGMPIALAKGRLNGVEAAFIRMDHGKYEMYSDRVMEILRGQVDVLEQAGVDEAFFDITKRTGGDYDVATALALELKSRILKEEKLSCSIGIGPNKVVAKIASDFKKPNGLTIVRDDEALAFLSSMSIDRIYGVGPKTAKLLEENGIKTIPDLASAPTERLEDLFSKKLAVYLHNASNGIDDEPVIDRGGISQLSRMITLKHDTHDLDQIVEELVPALKDINEKLISKNLFFKNVSAIGILKNLSLHTRSKTLETPTNDYSVLEREARELFAVLLREVGDLRRAGVRTSELQDMVNQQSLTEFTS